MNDEEISRVGAGYGLAALCLQMTFLNVLSGKGGVSPAIVEKIISHAKSGIPLLADPKDAPETATYASAAIDRLAQNWSRMRVGH